MIQRAVDDHARFLIGKPKMITRDDHTYEH